MKKHRLISALLLIWIPLLPGCGRKGPLLPPLMKTPKSVESVSVHQRGGAAVVTWRNPTACIDGSPLDQLEKVDIYMAQIPPEEFSSGIPEDLFREKARLIETISKDALGEYFYPENPALLHFIHSFETEAINTSRFAFAMKVTGGRRKESAFSSPVFLVPAPVSRPPLELKARTEKDGVLLSWEPPDENITGTTPALVQGYNIYKNSPGEEKTLRLNSSPHPETEFKDPRVEWGVTYRYRVRATVSPSSFYPESDDSETIEVTPRDIFPPEPPEGLTAIAGSGFVALSWRDPQAADLEGYRVWRRKKGEGKFNVLTRESIRDSSYIDRTVENGMEYQYRVTAVDTAGNESAGSEAVTAAVRK